MGWRRRGHRSEGTDHVQARPRVQCGVCRVTPICERLHWRRHQGRAALAAAGDHQQCGDIGPVLASKELEIPLEDRPQTDTGLKSAIVEQEGSARDTVCPDDALVAIHRQQRAGRILPGRRDRNDPMVTEMLAKEPLFYGARRIHRKGAGQGMRLFRALRIDGGYVQHRQQATVNAEGPARPSSSNSYAASGNAGFGGLTSISSAQTPPSQVPQYSNSLASIPSPRCSIATPAVSQNRIVYPASRTTLYRRSRSSFAVETRVPSGSRGSLRSPRGGRTGGPRAA